MLKESNLSLQRNWQTLIKPEQLDIEFGSDASRVATIVAEPLERGFGMTLGNSLRRILLSSLQGAAVTSVRIDGVLHEFSTLAGVREDVTDIVLNIKQLAVRMHGEGPKRMVLTATGPGEVKAGQIQSGHDIEIMNPDLVLCTLDDGASAWHGIHGGSRPRLCAGFSQPAGRCADRADPGGCDLFSGASGFLSRGTDPRWPGDGL